jgi:hypothetical protein
MFTKTRWFHGQLHCHVNSSHCPAYVPFDWRTELAARIVPVIVLRASTGVLMVLQYYSTMIFYYMCPELLSVEFNSPVYFP